MQNDYGVHALEREERAWRLLQWGSAAPLAEFDEALAVQGFYSRAQKERSDQALDLFDQEMREPPGLSELDAFRILEARGFLQADSIHQQKPQMDSTPTPQTRTEESGRSDEIVKPSAAITSGEGIQDPIKDALRRGLPDNRTSTPGTRRGESRPQLTPTTNAVTSGRRPEVNWIWDGWIAEGYFHTLIAMQKVGKSTFLLNLIAELIQRTPSFLNFPLSVKRSTDSCW